MAVKTVGSKEQKWVEMMAATMVDEKAERKVDGMAGKTD